MCMQRDPDDCDRLVYPFPLFDFIDLTMDELGGDGDGAVMDAGDVIDDDDDAPVRDNWNYPYNLLPSMQIVDDDVPMRLAYADFLEDLDYSAPLPDNYIPTNTNPNITQSTSVNVNVNIAETDGTDQSNEGREFELNIPQILLSMSTISNNLFGELTNFHN